MALNDLVRNGVALAKSLTSSLQASVTHEARSASDAESNVSYSTGVSRPALVEFKPKMVRNSDGEQVLASCIVTFLEPVTITLQDRITLPDGSKPKIVSTETLINPDTNAGYYQVVYLG